MNAIPNDLRTLPQWVAWKRETRNDKETKVPISPITGRGASSTDESTWSSYEQACAYVRENRLAGIGFMFKKDGGYVGIDLDHVRNLETGELEEWARDIIAIMDSYTEVSQSGTGVHILCKGTLPGDKRRKGQVEMYDQGRYFVMTGIPLDGTSLDIQERQDELGLIYEEFLAEKDPPAAPESETPRPTIVLDDTELLQKAMAAANGAKFTQLWSGNAGGYASQSEADLALCCMLAFWSGKNAEQIDRLFRQSGLMRDKWDEQHGKDTYGQLTVSLARSKTRETYNSQSSRSPNFPDISSPMMGREKPTDAGNAKRMNRLFGRDLHYCKTLEGWFLWRNGRWESDDNGEVQEMAKATAISIELEALEEPNPTRQKRMLKWAETSESGSHVDAMVRLAKTEPGIPLKEDDFDKNPWLLNCRNGTIDLRTGELREHRREDLITKLAPVDFDPDATDEILERYLDDVTGGDREFRDFLQRAVGYSITGCTTEEVFFLVLGPAQTGKSTLIQAIIEMLGVREYGWKAPFQTFLDKIVSSGATPEVATLRGLHFVAAVETSKDTRLAEPLIKELTGGDTITARHLYSKLFSFKPKCKLWLATNESPMISDTDTGIWRRLVRVPFEHIVPPEKRDDSIKEHLTEDPKALSALLAWAVKGCLLWQQEGLGRCRVVEAKTNDLRADMNPLGEFLDSFCVISPRTQVEARVLRQAYEEWAKENGACPIGNRDWGERLRQVGAQQKRVMRNCRKMTIWEGIGLRSDEDEVDTMDTTDTTIPIINSIFDAPEYIDNNTQNPVSSCPPVHYEAPPEPQWKPKPSDLVRRIDGFGNRMGDGPWRVLSIEITEKARVEYAKITLDGNEEGEWISWTTCRLEPWEPPQEKSADEDAEWF